MSYKPEELAQYLDRIRGGTELPEDEASLEHDILQMMGREGLSGLTELLRSVPGYKLAISTQGLPANEAKYFFSKNSGPELTVYVNSDPDLNFVQLLVEQAEVVGEDQDQDPFYVIWESLLELDEAAIGLLDPQHKAVFYIGKLESELMNGGFGQYLANTDGKYLAPTFDVLDIIGASLTHQLLEQAVRLSADSESYDAAWETHADALSGLDDRFLQQPENHAGLTTDAFEVLASQQ